MSLWSYVNHPAALSAFISSLYEPYEQPLWPSVAPQSIVSGPEKILGRKPFEQEWGHFCQGSFQYQDQECLFLYWS